MAERVRYYRGRVLDRLQQHGFPLRSRSLLFFERTEARAAPAPQSYTRGGTIGPVSEEQFGTFRWDASPDVIREALCRRAPGRRWAIAARRGDEMDAFCWLEADTADMFFFDMSYVIPEDTRYLARVWVRPQLRGEGIGRALIRCAESFAADSGATRLFSACVPHNGAMRRLFAELGWSYQLRVDYRRAGPAMLFRVCPDGEPARSAWSLSTAARILASCAAASGPVTCARGSPLA